jgi:hypothetical protein
LGQDREVATLLIWAFLFHRETGLFEPHSNPCLRRCEIISILGESISVVNGTAEAAPFHKTVFRRLHRDLSVRCERTAYT